MLTVTCDVHPTHTPQYHPLIFIWLRAITIGGCLGGMGGTGESAIGKYRQGLWDKMGTHNYIMWALICLLRPILTYCRLNTNCNLTSTACWRWQAASYLADFTSYLNPKQDPDNVPNWDILENLALRLNILYLILVLIYCCDGPVSRTDYGPIPSMTISKSY